MAATGLAQIDENSSLLQTHGNEPLLLPNLLRSTPQLPNLLRSSPQLDSMGEKTPEVLPKRLSFGDATPEAWPKTPTPHGFYSRGFALGDQTPESWPECAPSFRMDAPQQVLSHQAPAVMLPSVGMNSLQPLVQMWPGQIAYPLGMVFDGNMMGVANMCAPPNTVAPPVLYNGSNAIARAVERPAEKVSTPRARIDSSSTKFTPPKKPSRPANPEASSDDACPVAVYVDLSALRERGSAPRQGGSRR